MLPMENFEIGKEDLLTGGGLQMDDRSASEWRQAAGWAKAFAILCIVGLCIVILAIAIIFLFSGYGSSLVGSAEVAGFIFGFLLVLGFGGLWIVNLFRFSNNVPAAINNCDVTGFEKSILALKNFFKIAAIISILSVLVSFITMAIR